MLSQPPRAVRLVFNEPVQPIGRGLRVIGPEGRRVDRGRVRVAGAVVAVDVEARASGTYRVVWSVISPDTHPDFGTMAFSVLRPGGVLAEGAPAGGGAAVWGTVLGALAHLVHFAGYALGFGTLAAAWLAGRADPPSGVFGAPDLIWRGTGIGIALLLFAEPIAFAAESVALGAAGGGADPAVIGALLDSSFGRVLAQRLAAAILLWVLAGALQSGALRAAWTVPLLGVGLAFVDGQAAHATGVRPAWWGLGINTVHLGAMGLWGGALALVIMTQEPARSVRRLALAAGIAAVASGVVMAFQHVSGIRDFVASPYGRALAVKICAVAAVAGLGWFGARRAAGPRLLAWEAAVMLVVLALAGVLVLLRPPVP